MALSRYASPDSYTLEELRREYHIADAKGRVRLLRRLNREVGIPADLLALAVKDDHSYVRQWVARFGYLYGEYEAQLANDPDEFIRSCLKENPSRNHVWLSKDWQEAFQNASHWDRLAIVRHPHVDDELIEKIFDPDNQEFGLDMDSRRQLASAFLSNEIALNCGQISYGDWCSRVGTDDASGFIDVHQSARKHYDNLWALASKWPAADIELGVRYWIYRYVGADDKTKSKTYKECEEPALRRAILRNKRPPVDPYGSSLHENPATSELTKLALKDPDAECRQLALDRAGSESQPTKRSKYVSYAWSALWASLPNAIGVVLALKILSSTSTGMPGRS